MHPEPIYLWHESDHSPEDALLGIIAQGDIEAARAYFDKTFWEGREVRPEWRHLKAALLKQDRSMVRLLVTWGATANSYGLADLRDEGGGKVYPWAVNCLRGCGLNVNMMPVEEDHNEETVTEEEKQDRINQRWDAQVVSFTDTLPQEWKNVLQVFQQQGAGEAVIAGGALRDLFNGRPVKDVDIFMRSRGSEKKNKKFLKKVFKKVGLNIAKESISYSYGDKVFDAVNKSSRSIVVKAMVPFGSGVVSVSTYTGVESWNVTAGPQRTEYNIVFVDDFRLSVNGNSGVPLSECLINGFDFGLCQIACDGKKLTATKAYIDDVKNRKITLCEPDSTSKDHLERIVKKYPDWTLCDKSQKLLSPAPAAEPAVGDKMQDGSIYLGFYEDKDWYVAAQDARDRGGKRLKLSFNAAAACAKNLKDHGHNDWQVPPQEILQKMAAYKDVGAFRGSYDEECDSSWWYWSSTLESPRKGAHIRAYLCNFDVKGGGVAISWHTDAHESVRCVRAVPRQKKNSGDYAGPR